MGVKIIGIGLGNPDTLTIKALKEIKKSDILIGATRILQSFDNINATKFSHISPNDILNCILNHKEQNISVLMSGDTGFFSGTSKLINLLKEHNITFDIISGISSLSYLFSKISLPYDDVKCISLHGRDINPTPYIKRNAKTFILTDSTNTPKKIAKSLENENGLTFYVGENLSYDDEKITKGSALEISQMTFSSLSVIAVINENPSDFLEFGIDDEKFIKTTSPMTKSEVRAVIMSKLRLKNNDISYDIGSGSGSVTVEMAKISHFGKVYAIEKKASAIEITKANIAKFNLTNTMVLEGLAPDILENLEPPNVVFIGGSSGNLKEIVNSVLEKNKNARIVISAITLETISEALGISKNFENSEICMINVSKSKKIANYNMMIGQNPIYIISFGGDLCEI